MPATVQMIKLLREISGKGLQQVRDVLLEHEDPHVALAVLDVRGHLVVRSPERWRQVIAEKAARYRAAYPNLAAAPSADASLPTAGQETWKGRFLAELRLLDDDAFAGRVRAMAAREADGAGYEASAEDMDFLEGVYDGFFDAAREAVEARGLSVDVDALRRPPPAACGMG